MKKNLITAALAVLILSQISAGEQDYRKAVIMEMTSRQGYVAMDDVRVVYGVAPRVLYDFEDDASLKMVVRTKADDVWWTRIIQDPRHCQIADEEGELEETESHYVIRESSQFTVVIPFKRTLKSMTVYDYSTGDVIGSFDLSEHVSAFCRKQVYDEECQEQKPEDIGGGAAEATTTTIRDRSPPTTTTQPRRPGITVETRGGVVGGIISFVRGMFGR
ncbi:MAG: hypothetical protein GF416_07735 [Candidatus Altiarchaeales archaeon]|nr:hypothetical protein [Candidatus Altiarchaeales archaeon]MBD3417003.1 hypothetical protein [Candidatus Altiarchaeales archaeon]